MTWFSKRLAFTLSCYGVAALTKPQPVKSSLSARDGRKLNDKRGCKHSTKVPEADL
jgi:hypothetical protein